ncbi:hypothetical protein ACOKM5_13510 [Streptomyces sp. BH097]|uniref:hypothetical protein n=1 Tax=unclassified Streptomyces TaxID=2593676 RepID=UPI003BB66131
MLSVVIALVAIKLGAAEPSGAVGGGSGGAGPIRTAASSTPPTEDPTSDEPTDDPTSDEPTDDPTSDEPADDPTSDEPSPTDTYVPIHYEGSGTAYYSCAREGQIASAAGVSTTWEIENDSSTDLTLYWLDSRGMRSAPRRLESGGTINFTQVNTGSVYVFVGRYASCSAIVRIDPAALGSSGASTTVTDKD